MHIRTLATSDAITLLAFEIANRRWFEQHIDARAPSFYSPAGVAEHIAEYLGKYDNGQTHPCVLVGDEGQIIGRTNLKGISRDTASAEIGYRIDQNRCGKGLASAALAHMLKLAYGHWRLQEVNAYITVKNAASARVLQKQGFEQVRAVQGIATVAGELVDGFHLRHQAAIRGQVRQTIRGQVRQTDTHTRSLT